MPLKPTTPDTPASAPFGGQEGFPDNPKAASIDRATGQPAKLATGPVVPDPKISPDAAETEKKNPTPSIFFGGGKLDGSTAIPAGAVRDRNELRSAHKDGVDIYTLGDPDFAGPGDRWQYSRTEPLYRAPLSGPPESVNADASAPDPVVVGDTHRDKP